MSQFEFHLVHQIPGRVRFKLAQSLNNSEYVQIQQLTQNITGVSNVRINSVAQSIIINFKENKVSSQTIQEQLAIAIQQVVFPTILPPASNSEVKETDESESAISEVVQAEETEPQETEEQITAQEESESASSEVVQAEETESQETEEQITAQEELESAITEVAKIEDPLSQETEDKQSSLIVFNFVSNLNTYETEQKEKISQWLEQKPDEWDVIESNLLSPLKFVSDVIIPEFLLLSALDLCEKIANQWHIDWESLKGEAKVNDPSELKQGSLEFSDRLAEEVKNQAVFLATSSGAFAALLPEVGELTEIPLSIIQALHTIHKIGLCYGYVPESQCEQMFAWLVLAVCIALTPEEKQLAFSGFCHLQHTLYRQTFDEILEDVVEENVFNSVREAVFRKSIQYLGENFALDNIPIVGSVFGAINSRDFIEQVSDSACRSFQLRWFVTNNKLELEKKSNLEPLAEAAVVLPVTEQKTHRQTRSRKKLNNTNSPRRRKK